MNAKDAMIADGWFMKEIGNNNSRDYLHQKAETKMEDGRFLAVVIVTGNNQYALMMKGAQ